MRRRRKLYVEQPQSAPHFLQRFPYQVVAESLVKVVNRDDVRHRKKRPDAFFLYHRHYHQVLSADVLDCSGEILGQHRVTEVCKNQQQCSAAQPQTLTVNNIPAGGQLTLNGRTVQITGPTAAAKVLPGQYTVVVKRIGMPDFVQIIRVAAGQNPVVNVTVAGAARPVGLPAPTSVSGHSTLAGQWFGVMMSPPSPFENNRSVTLNLAGSGSRLSGKLVVRSSVKLKGYKRRQCNGAEGANWETTYQASFVQMPGGGVIRGSGGIQTSCSCSAMCSTSNEVSFDVFVSPTKTVMAGEDLLWQRQTGATAPARATMSRIDPSKLGGAWHVRSGNVKQDTQSPMTLQVSGNGVSGTTSITATNSLGWRKRECNGQSEMTANYNFAVSGEVVGGVAAISFAKGSPAYSDCPCKASVCSAMAGGMRLGSQKFKMSLDGNHLIGNGMLLSRK